MSCSLIAFLWKDSCQRCFRGHDGPVSTLSDKILGDGDAKVFASGGEDVTVRFWSLGSSSKRGQHALRATLQGHEKAVKLMSITRGGHIVKSFQPLLDPTSEAVAGTSEVPVKKISRKKNPTTSGVADVEQIEVPSKGPVSNTQERDEKGGDEVEKDDDVDEYVEQRDGKGVVVVEEEAEVEEDEEDESDESERPMTKKYHLGVLSRHRLTIPHSKMVARYADVLLGSSSRGARRYLSSLPPSHELALVIRNVAELSALSGHSLRHSLRNDAIQRRYRKKIRGVQAENERLNNELTSEKARLTELTTTAMQLKADVARISNEK
ncbi:hypothetical protein Dimus_029073 [Dionaea muscipula]